LRLFNLDHSNWSDYDSKLISEGGGVWPRTAKSVPISEPVRNILGVKNKAMTPAELISAILKAPVELFWNGGIGTFIKASDESQDDADDRANDALRVNADELRCKVYGEGGNLGLTQRARIEFALNGGRINTDFIDNSGGVDCSDHEVNIKILLNAIMREGALEQQKRNQLLEEMTEEVSRLVLINNYQQSEAVSLSEHLGPMLLDEHSRLIRDMERKELLQRKTWNLPDEEVLSNRRSADAGLTRPELSVLLAFSKIDLYHELLNSDVLDEPYLADELPIYFPHQIAEQYSKYLGDHPLRREIVATFISNSMINRMGIAFPFRLQEHSGMPVPEIACAYLVTRKIFALPELWQQISQLDNKINAKLQLDMLNTIRRLANHCTLWLLQNIERPVYIGQSIERYSEHIGTLVNILPELVADDDQAALQKTAENYQEQNVPEALAWRMAGMPFLFPGLDIVEVALQTEQDPTFVAQVFNRLGSFLELHWLRDQIDGLSKEEHWTRLARSALRDELYRLQRNLTVQVINSRQDSVADPKLLIESWLSTFAQVYERYNHRFVEFKSGIVDLALISVALNELQRLIRDTEGSFSIIQAPE
jgi:glutamate dehydrogenase